MERLIDLFCHAIRISDPLSIKIAVGIIGGGLPLIFIVVALTKLGEFWARQREPPCSARKVKMLCPTCQITAKKAIAVALAPPGRSNRLEK